MRNLPFLHTGLSAAAKANCRFEQRSVSFSHDISPSYDWETKLDPLQPNAVVKMSMVERLGTGCHIAIPLKRFEKLPHGPPQVLFCDK
jgi:hypothetical protein